MPVRCVSYGKQMKCESGKPYLSVGSPGPWRYWRLRIGPSAVVGTMPVASTTRSAWNFTFSPSRVSFAVTATCPPSGATPVTSPLVRKIPGSSWARW